MIDWLNDNSAVLELGLSFGILLIWLTYLHLFLMAYLRERTPTILINRGAGTGLDSRCLLSNMSAEPIHIQSVVAGLTTPNDQYQLAVTDIESLDDTDGGEPISRLTSQGPLGRGKFMDLASFRHLIGRVVRDAGVPSGRLDDLDDRPEVFELTVIAVYGSDDLLIAARRSFRLSWRGTECALVPTSTQAQQIRSRRERHQVRRMLERNL